MIPPFDDEPTPPDLHRVPLGALRPAPPPKTWVQLSIVGLPVLLAALWVGMEIGTYRQVQRLETRVRRLEIVDAGTTHLNPRSLP